MRLTPSRAQLAKRLRATSECAQWADLLPTIVSACNDSSHWLQTEWPALTLGVLEKSDAIRRPERLVALLDLAKPLVQCDVERWQQALRAARAVDAGAIARPLQAQGASAISKAVRAARLEAVKQVFAVV